MLDTPNAPTNGAMTESPATNLTPGIDRFIGRRAEMREFSDRLEEQRLVTILGPPGTGKTRFAREFGLRRAASENVWFCDLVHARRAEEILVSIARAFGLEFETTLPADARRQRLRDRLRHADRPTLLILDNFEQIVRFAPQSVGWLVEATARADVRVVVTSRHELKIAGEHVWPLGPLLPVDASELFVERARDAGVTVEPGPVVDELVERVDRLPLAIELAAARASVLPPEKMLDRLENRFKLLAGSRRDVDERQRTLRGAIDWSWDLLDERDRRAYARLATCHGGFDLRAAEALLTFDDDDDAPWPIDLVDALVQRSIVHRSGSDGEARFAMYESIRAFGEERLEDVDDAASVFRDHARWYAAQASRRSPSLGTADSAEAARWMREERANVSVAFERMRAADEPELATTLALALSSFDRFSGESSNAALDFLTNSGDPDARAIALLRRGARRMQRGDFAAARDDFEAGAGTEAGVAPVHEFRLAELARKTGDLDEAITRDRALAQTTHDLRRQVLAHLAVCLADAGSVDEAREAADQARERDRCTDFREECVVLKRLAYVAYFAGELDRQREYNVEAVELAREIGDRRQEALALQALGDSAFARRDWREALTWWEEAIAVHDDLGHREAEAALRANIGAAHHRLGELDDARDAYEEALSSHRRFGAREPAAIALHALGALSAEQGDFDAAREQWQRAREAYVELRSESDVAAMDLCIGWLGDDDAAERLSDAAERFDELGETSWGDVARASAGEKVADQEGLPGALIRARTATASDDDVERLGASTFGRIALLAASSDVDDATDDHVTLRLGPEHRWFELDDGERVSLGRRGAIRRVLGALVDRLENAPGEGLDVWDLFEVGWPDEQSIDTDAAAERVYWSVKTLRNKLGFDELLLTRDDGYVLDPASVRTVHVSE